jgi:hypothetical protein
LSLAARDPEALAVSRAKAGGAEMETRAGKGDDKIVATFGILALHADDALEKEMIATTIACRWVGWAQGRPGMAKKAGFTARIGVARSGLWWKP